MRGRPGALRQDAWHRRDTRPTRTVLGGCGRLNVRLHVLGGWRGGEERERHWLHKIEIGLGRDLIPGCSDIGSLYDSMEWEADPDHVLAIAFCGTQIGLSGDGTKIMAEPINWDDRTLVPASFLRSDP